MSDDKIKKFPLSKEAKKRLALRKKEQKKLFDEILKDTEAGKIEKQLDKVSPKFKKQLEKELLALRKYEYDEKQRLAEKKAKEELKKGKVDITGEKGGKKISQYVAEETNKKNKKKKIKSLLKKGVKVGSAFFTTLLTPTPAK